MGKKLRGSILFLLLSSIFFSGCAGLMRSEPSDHRDPWETTNRAIFDFNEKVDENVLRPLAVGYERSVPQSVRTGVVNFFSNLSDLMTAVHHLFQFNFRSSSESAIRFLVNSTVGILGFADVATNMGIAKTEEDTGQTLGTYGIPSGAYVVLPFLGPSSVRDSLGRVVDIMGDPFNNIVPDRGAKLAGNALKIVDTRARMISAEQAFEALAFDRYIGMRSAYFAIREAQIND
jgi:phospholipid-binding lipoprotein MlaA